jgi:urease alpha subunit
MNKIMNNVIGNNGFEPPVPAQDSADNVTISDVIGNKTDTHSGDSLYSHAETIDDHLHGASKVYPTLADGVTITATNGAGTWTLGTVVEVVPASTITSDFDVHHVSIESLSANSVYELVLYAGAGDTEIGRVRITKNAAQDGTMNIPIQTPIVDANSRIRAAVATTNDNGETVDISLFYHTY